MSGLRLTKLKIAGFKSFVEPTTVLLPSNMTAVVGPNGCGKSNIIDAVNWVMGERSAKELRMESMAEVIFNGSANRAPLGQASVELYFDNSDASLGGEYGTYAEVVVRREVKRDGTSNYSINNTRCRRRDVTNLFLGTGLGPRSYAIIKQDTITRLIEAKPDELRGFIEEAAGISKYKERRRETETRMRHTRDNLSRLSDLREELGKQLERLERQAKAAERYKVLKQESSELSAQVQALHWRGLSQQVQEQQQALQKLETELTAAQSDQVRFERELEEKRQQYHEVNERLDEVQTDYYGAGAAIARLEEALESQRKRLAELDEQLAQLNADEDRQRQQRDGDQRTFNQITEQLKTLLPQKESIETEAKQAAESLAQAELATGQWQSEWNAFTERAADTLQKHRVAEQKLVHLTQRQQERLQRIQSLQQEKSQIDLSALHQAMNTHAEQLSASETQWNEQKSALSQASETFDQQRQRVRDLSTQRSEIQEKLQQLNGEETALRYVQQTALGQRDETIQSWLNEHALADNPRLAQVLRVTPGWERAVEVVLGDFLQAVCVNDLEKLSTALQDQTLAGLNVLDFGANGAASDIAGNTSSALTPLHEKVKAEHNLKNILANIFVAENLTEAFAQRQHLNASQSIVTPAGLWLGPDWLRLPAKVDDEGSVLNREQQLTTLQEEIAERKTTLASLEESLQEAEAQLVTLENKKETSQTALNELTRKKADEHAQLQVSQARHEQATTRSEQIEKTLGDLQTQQESEAEEQQQLNAQQESATLEKTDHDQQKSDLAEKGETLRAQLAEARTRQQQTSQSAHQYTLKVETLRAQEQAAQQSLSRLQTRLDEILGRRGQLVDALQQQAEPQNSLQEELDAKLAARLTIEERLTHVRTQRQAIEDDQSQLEKSRESAQQRGEALRGKMESQRLKSQEFTVRQKTIEEKLTEDDRDLQQVLNSLPEEASSELWEDNLEQLGRRIQRLGAINLAAIDEFQEVQTRKELLDKQDEDLSSALATLEGAIRKIDQETRTRFKQTLDTVNNGFQTLFPKIFNGGKAGLELTDADLLSSGVVVKASPPGKRNSSVHALSGGEKALTALALVFSIFKLNPAPFCLLDEVDAPLDDANVQRYGRLVAEMSSQVQFLFVTHNKVTMEIANQLIGVTMKEPGVSRLVAVDISDAMAMADA